MPLVSAQAQPALPTFSGFSDSVVPPVSQAQPPSAEGCFIVRNVMESSIYGQIATEQFTRPDGIVTRHRSTFKLHAKDARDPKTNDPLDIAEFCTTGPFFEGGKIQLELKTLMPIFTCLTRIDQGEIVVRNMRDADGNNKIFAGCYE